MNAAEQRSAASALFGEIAASAASLREVMAEAIQHCGGGDDTGAALTVGARAMVDQLGWLADRGAALCGGSMVVGGADDWMLSPVLRGALGNGESEASHG